MLTASTLYSWFTHRTSCAFWQWFRPRISSFKATLMDSKLEHDHSQPTETSDSESTPQSVGQYQTFILVLIMCWSSAVYIKFFYTKKYGNHVLPCWQICKTERHIHQTILVGRKLSSRGNHPLFPGQIKTKWYGFHQIKKKNMKQVFIKLFDFL